MNHKRKREEIESEQQAQETEIFIKSIVTVQKMKQQLDLMQLNFEKQKNKVVTNKQ